MLYQGRLDEAEPWLERAERTLRTEVEPAAGMSLLMLARSWNWPGAVIRRR